MRILLLPIIIILTTSCFSHRGLSRNAEYLAEPFAISMLNGLYENVIPGDPDNSLWEDLYKNKSHKDLIFNSYRTHVGLEMLSDKELNVKLYRKGTLEDQFTLKGRVKDGYFVIYRRLSTLPIPFAFFWAENKTIIGNDDQNNLVLVQGQSNSLLLFFCLTGGDSDTINARYARL